MKTTLYILTVAAAILTGMFVYGRHVDNANREEAQQAWARAEQSAAQHLAETQATSGCLKVKIQYAKLGLPLHTQKLLLENQGFNLDCSVKEGGR